MIHETITPSGISITFEDGEPDPTTGKSKRRSYLVNGEKLVSVTTILGILDKPGLMWAAEKLAVLGAIELAREGELPLHVDGALSRMKARGLRFRQVWDKKAERGTVTHEDLVALCKGESPKELDSYPPDQRGFIRGASSWYADFRPEVIDSETMVASPTYGFAGRYDLFASFNVNGLRGRGRVDLKTTEEIPTYANGDPKPPYPENLLQLGGYEPAAIESGYEASDFQAVLRIDASGAYDFWVTLVEPKAFLAVLGAYQALKGLPAKRHEVEAVAA